MTGRIPSRTIRMTARSLTGEKTRRSSFPQIPPAAARGLGRPHEILRSTTMAPHPRVHTGLEVLSDRSFAPLRGLRIGLVTHPAAIDAQFRHARDLLAEA